MWFFYLCSILIIYLILGCDIELADDALEEFWISLFDEQYRKSYNLLTAYHRRKNGKILSVLEDFKHSKAQFVMHKDTCVFSNTL